MKYKFSDLGKKLDLINKQCQQINAKADFLQAQGKHVQRIETDKAIKACKKKHAKHYGNTSKYTPHQGYQECERRRTA